MSENKNTQSQGCGYDDRCETESETNLSDSNNCSSHDSPRDRSSTKSTSQRSSFADLRNQVTIVSPGMQTAVNAEYHSEKPSAPQIDDSLELPFTAGNFQADELLARGGMSITYLGHKCDDPAEKVVIKIPDMNSPRTVSMFVNECRILSELTHPNIVPILEYGNININGSSLPYMVMKYIDGQSIRRKLKVQGSFSWEEASQVLEHISSALDYLYLNNFCHRDIKPDNIIYDTASGQWVLVDFGIAKSLQDNIMLTMTMAGHDSGTWDYMPPEQLSGRSVDIRCDIYALGTVIWEILIGTVPRRGTKLPSAYGVDLPADVDILIGRMVEHDPKDRYQNPQEILSALKSGARRIETWKKTQSVFRKTLKVSAIALGTLFALTVIWFIGDFATVAKLKEIYEKHKSSATVTLRELTVFSNKMPFFWGNRYITQVMPELLRNSEAEKKNMQKEFAGIEKSVKNHDGTDDELENRKLICDNFITKWQSIFPSAEEITVADQNRKPLKSILLLRREIKEVENKKRDIKKKTASKKLEDYQKALAECEKLENRLTLPETKKSISDFASELRNTAMRDGLSAVDKLINSSRKKDWDNALVQIELIEKALGKNPQLQQRVNNVDDNYWNYFRNEAEKALSNNHFALARTNVEEYLKMKIGMTKHKNDVEEFRKKIDREKEKYDWSETDELIGKYIKDKAFPAALAALERFQKKYPETQIADLAAERKKIAGYFLTWIVDQRKDWDSYTEQMDIFLGKFPEEKEGIETLKRNLCWAAWNKIQEITFGNSSAKTESLLQIKYTKCTDSQRSYLDSLKNHAVEYVKNPDNKSKWYKFYYHYERPPEDCVYMSQRRIYRVTITDFSYSLSNADFNEYKGDFAADVQVQIRYDGTVYSFYAPKNSQSWTVDLYEGKPMSFWLDTTGSPLTAGVKDGDFWSDNSLDRIHSFEAKNFSKSGTESFTFNTGTKITLTWTTK